MAAGASLLADGHEAVPRARPRAAHEQQVSFGIYLDHLEAELREAARPGLAHGHRHVRALRIAEPRHAELASDECVHVLLGYSTLISTSTPAGRSSFVNASTVWDLESRMSISRLCVFSSNCSRLFLSMCGLRSTVQSCRLVGSGIGPETWAPVFSAVRTMSAAA